MSHAKNDTASPHEKLSPPAMHAGPTAAVNPENQNSTTAHKNDDSVTHAASASAASELHTADSNLHKEISVHTINEPSEIDGASADVSKSLNPANLELDENVQLKKNWLKKFMSRDKHRLCL